MMHLPMPRVVAALCVALVAGYAQAEQSVGFSQPEVALLLANFAPQAAPRPSSKVSGVRAAIDLGEQLFFSPVLSRHRDMSCATCHQPDAHWTDGKPVAEDGQRNTPTLWNVANQRWFFWDGRADSLWSQSLHVMEGEAEFDLFRTGVAQRILSDPQLKARYEGVFGAIPRPDSILAIAACGGSADCQEVWAQLEPGV